MEVRVDWKTLKMNPFDKIFQFEKKLSSILEDRGHEMDRA